MTTQMEPDTSAPPSAPLISALYNALAHLLDLYDREDAPTPEHAVALDAARQVLALADAAGQAAPTHEATIGVGDGRGQLFVHGSYEAIKRVQAFIFDAESYRKLGRTDEAAPVPPPVEGLETTEEKRAELARGSIPNGLGPHAQDVRALVRDFAKVHDCMEGLAKEVERLKAKYEPGHTDLMVSPEAIDEALAAEAKLAVYEAPIGDGESVSEIKLRDWEVRYVPGSPVRELVAEVRRLSAAHAECKGENTKLREALTKIAKHWDRMGAFHHCQEIARAALAPASGEKAT